MSMLDSGRIHVLVILLALSLVAIAFERQTLGCRRLFTNSEIGGIRLARAQKTVANTTASRIMVYYHLYAVNNWEATAADQLNKLVYSGLLEKAAIVYGCVSSPDKNTSNDAADFLNMFGPKIQAVYFTPAHTAMERATLWLMRNMTLPSDKIFYFHSKGVSAKNQEPAVARNIMLWRNLMEYMLIKHWQNCVDFLQEYDVVGTDYISTSPSHFSGNFWWTTGQYFLSLPQEIRPDYVGPEIYILENPNARIAQVWSSTGQSIQGGVLYHNAYPPSAYLGLESLPLVPINESPSVLFKEQSP